MGTIIKSNLQQRKWLRIIILGGLFIRLFFILVGGKFYFGTAAFQIQGDTGAWVDSIMNLIKYGTYTCDLTVPNASFFRPPGYAFIIGIFYFLAGKNIEMGLQLLSWAQILLDTVSIWMVFHISKRTSSSNFTPLIAAALYATYPFIIIWTPVLYAESTSVFFMLASIYFLVDNEENNRKYFYSGILAGLSVLTRLQCIFLIPGLVFYAWKKSDQSFNLKSGIVTLLLSFGLVYGLWPARNLMLHQRLIFSQELKIGKHWSPDFMSFMEFILAIKTDHQPQYQQLIENREVIWPKDAYIQPGDSLLLASTIEKCKTCGTGFSYFKFHAGLISAPLSPGQNCDKEIESNFRQLINSQKKYNSLNYYFKTPLSNLKKALFKISLYGNKSTTIKLLGGILFSYRTILIILGLLAVFLNYKKGWFDIDLGTMILFYFIFWYFFLSFVYRNMEIRYLLHCDLLLLIPLASLINEICTNIQSNKKLKHN